MNQSTKRGNENYIFLSAQLGLKTGQIDRNWWKIQLKVCAPNISEMKIEFYEFMNYSLEVEDITM